MKFHGNCPGCDERVSLLQYIFAPTPNHLRCSGCKAPLVVRMQGLLFLILLTLLVLLGLAYALIQILRADGLEDFGIYLGLAVGVWLFMEGGIALLVFNKAELEIPEHYRKNHMP